MHSTELSLVFFTTISQMAAGLMMVVLPFVFSKNPKSNSNLNQYVIYSAAGLMLIALILSFLHLNNPVNAIYALSNLKTSWLSREILFVSFFLFCLGLLSFMLYFKKTDVAIFRPFVLFTAIMGAVLVYAMSKLYIIPTVPAWNTASTLVKFYSTALLIGSAFVLGLAFYNELKSKNELSQWNNMKMLVYLALFAVVIITINGLFFSPAAPEGNVAFEPQPLNRSLMVMRWLTLLLGAISILYLLIKKSRLTKVNLFIYLPFLFFLLSELIARVGFYTSFYRVGL